MKFSIITVSYNAETEIELTIASVLDQQYDDYEYIVIDGGSTDKTLEIVKKHNVEYISESDNGIYDGMNKGVQKCKGEYVLFLNAGDYFASNDVLKKASDKLSAEIAYGDVILLNSGLYKYHEAEKLSQLNDHMAFCHQCVFTKRNLLLRRKYNTDYRVLADYDFYLYYYLNGASFEHLLFPIAVYKSGGFSSKHAERSKKEKTNIKQKYLLKSPHAPFSMVRNILKKVVPTFMYRKYMAKRLLQLGYKYSKEEAMEDYLKIKNQ